MATKLVKIRPKGTGDYADVLHPETSASVVKMNDGTTVEDKITSHLADYTTAHGIDTKVSKAGDTMTGNLTLPAIDGDILIPDTRSVPINPGDLQKRVTVDFKAGNTIGLASNYYTVWTMCPWTDDSGGPAHQFAYGSDGLFYRQGLSSGWGSWQKVFHSGNQPQLRINNGSLQYDDGTGWKDVAISPIKSIQRGIVESSAQGNISITINAVNVNKSVVISSGDGFAYDNNTKAYYHFKYAVLQNSTTLVIKQRRYYYGYSHEWDDTNAVSLMWQVIEFN